jgi:hypothetical protein
LPSHGENRGSSPLGSANDFRDLVGATHTNEDRCLLCAKHSGHHQQCNKDACDVWTSTANRMMVCPRECPHANAIHPARSILYERPTDVPTNSPTKRKLFAVVRSRPYQGWQTVVTAPPPPRNDHGRVARVLPPFSSPAPHAADVSTLGLAPIATAKAGRASIAVCQRSSSEEAGLPSGDESDKGSAPKIETLL